MTSFLAARKSWLPPVLLVLAILVPYHRLTTMQGMIVTDDRILSDVFGAEFPARVEAARLLRAGELPSWTPNLCTGYPLLAGGVFPDPLSVATFRFMPPVVALNVFLLTTLIVAALGAYALSLRFGASTTGATLSGLAFSWSGYMVCQLKHLGVVSTVCWLPVGLLLLDRALSFEESIPFVRRALRLVPFTLVLAVQWLSNFPQSAYISTLAYGAFALAHAIVHLRKRARRDAFVLLASVFGCVLLAIACAAASLLPTRELGALSSRRGGVPFEFATILSYDPRDILTFFVPYANGDISDLSYRSHGLFWENYGYVGLFTMCLAIFAAVRAVRRFHVLFLVIAAVLAYLVVLGPATPFFKIVFTIVPGMNNFRFPTRFLVVVDLAIAILGGIGLTELEAWLTAKKTADHARWAAMAIVGMTAGDLIFHQLRQNPIADAKTWLAPPASARFLAAQRGHFRIYTLKHRMTHTLAWQAAKGWSDLAPYYAQRELLEPNTNLFWGLGTTDCYAGLLPQSTSIMWGEFGLIEKMHGREQDLLLTSEPFFRQLALSATRYLVSPWRVETGGAELVFEAPPAHVYRIPALPRSFIVRNAIHVDDPRAAADKLVAPDFDLTTQVVLELGRSIPPPPASSGPREGTVKFVSERATEIVLEAESKDGGWLVLADTWYPGWHAEVDGAEQPIARANGRHRAVALAPGAHRIRWWYRSESLATGLRVSGVALGTLLVAGLVLAVLSKRSTMSDARPS
ncbi:MAG: hypothetical protein ACXWP4_18545 [Polyangiales bacterium]